MIHFEADSLEAVHAGDRIQLLPKEFLLLRFLYEHAGRAFSREQLLDAVWPLESPVDRTVDDHIYRLRRKVAKWSHLLRVETIRGQGYKLTRIAPAAQDNPLLLDEQFAANVNRLLAKYHGLGMGAAMQLLSANRDILGLPGDPFYDAYIHFVQGDFGAILRSDRIDLSEKLAYAVFVLAVAQFDPAVSLSCFERLIARGDALRREWHFDLKLQIVPLYIEAGRPEKARAQLEALRPAIAELNSPSFTAIYLLKAMYLELHEGRLDAAAAKLLECEALLNQHPIQRERGSHLVFRAIFLYRQGAIRSARQSLDEGLEALRQTQFVPHLLGALHLTLTYLSAGSHDEPYRQKLEREWDRLAAEYRLGELLVQTQQFLERHL
ncbi:winged helix-turn-helix domain-containing protein [Cohnella lubricantis]|uniref:Winged helix-turn-helix transcriptional regulator n=1 Tax=Cohnella lubricantis TaxID=2163172 RepID=A0A841TIM7_9BACL|nr:winged helix-turn-helix domain-containing protein [Cohnella lubricantis]MBB6679098.1 winged helix-turn-helix transcriptional regulator [Cohnella lubricantis]MBP2119660.1 hypothetical protein [Cohnella lubricantis]